MAWESILTIEREKNGLLGPDDPAPFMLFNAEGASPFLLIGDHAGSAIPDVLGDLGLAPSDRTRHIALDIGVLGLGREMARLLDAPFLHQSYSRLVIDCNRDPGRPDAIPIMSDGSRIAGNQGLDDAARQARVTGIHRPYHAAIETILDARRSAGRETMFLSLHSFTPMLAGVVRPWHVGLMHGSGRTDLAKAMLQALAGDGDIIVGDNEPYAMDDTDYTVPHHAFPRDLPYAEVEVRQDLIATPAGETHWAARLATGCRAALPTCREGGSPMPVGEPPSIV
jgi:predicted N-formylglutamate amidohydrolase